MPRLDTFVRLADALHHCLVLVDHNGRFLEFDAAHESIVDRVGRHFPAHVNALSTANGAPAWWWGWQHIAWSDAWETIPAYVQERGPRRRIWRGSIFGEEPYAHPWVMDEIT